MAPPDAPAIRYARCGGVHIAWHEAGMGPRDLLFVHGWVSNVQANWEFPEIATFFRRLSAIGRLITFDKRGTGLSDRVPRMPTMDERLEDLEAVLEAAHARPAVLIGTSEGCALASLFAAAHPRRVAALVLYGGWARRTPAPDYPWAPTVPQRKAFLDEVLSSWGGPMDLSHLAPSRAGDAAFVDRFSAYLRASASPRGAYELARLNTYVDSRAALQRIVAPTLVLHRTGDRDAHVDEGRYVAAHIRGAQFVELPGDDHWPFVGEPEPVLAAITRFVESLPVPRALAPRDRPAKDRYLADPIAALTPRQREVLELMAHGLSNKEIASRIGLSEHTIHRHVADILGRLGAKTRAAAAAALLEWLRR